MAGGYESSLSKALRALPERFRLPLLKALVGQLMDLQEGLNQRSDKRIFLALLQ